MATLLDRSQKTSWTAGILVKTQAGERIRLEAKDLAIVSVPSEDPEVDANPTSQVDVGVFSQLQTTLERKLDAKIRMDRRRRDGQVVKSDVSVGWMLLHNLLASERRYLLTVSKARCMKLG